MFVAVNLEKKLLCTINVIAWRIGILKGTRYGFSEIRKFRRVLHLFN